MNKITLFTLSLTLGLTACFGGGTTNDTKSGTTSDADPAFFFTYSTAEFSIDVPDSWETINAFPSEYPDEIRVAFRNNIKEQDFLANLTIIRESGETLSNADLAQEKLSDHEDTLLNYKLLAQEEITLTVNGAESNSILNTFEGKNEASDHTIQFQQIYLTKGDKSWTVSASYLPTEDEFTIDRIDTMLNSFSLK